MCCSKDNMTYLFHFGNYQLVFLYTYIYIYYIIYIYMYTGWVGSK